MVRASLSAEAKLTRFGEATSSVSLSKARKKVQLYKVILSQCKTERDFQDQINRLQEASGVTDVPPNLTLIEASQAIKQSKREVRIIVRNHLKHREGEQEQRILANELENTKSSRTKAKQIRNIRKAEELKRLFQRLRIQTQSASQKGITRLEVPMDDSDNPKTCTNWRTLDVPTDILEALLRRNRKHFGQANGTPFTKPPLLHYSFNFDGVTGPDVQHVLLGKYDPQNVDATTALLLSKLSKLINSQTLEREDIQLMPWIMTPAEFRGKIKVWAEKTSTSPSKNHYKALYAPHMYQSSESPDEKIIKQDYEKKRDDLIELHCRLINYALRKGYSFKR